MTFNTNCPVYNDIEERDMCPTIYMMNPLWASWAKGCLGLYG